MFDSSAVRQLSPAQEAVGRGLTRAESQWDFSEAAGPTGCQVCVSACVSASYSSLADLMTEDVSS